MQRNPAGMADDSWRREDARRHRRKANGATDDGDALPLRYWPDLDAVQPPDRLIRRLLGTSALAVIYGEPACGKTFLATYLSLHIALGRAVFGRRVTRGAVLYIAAEGAIGITNRIAAFRQGQRDLPDDVPFVVVPVPVNIGPDGPDVPKIVAAAREVEEHTGLPVVCIVLDTLARTIGAGDENTAMDMGAYVTRCDKIRAETGATVIVVHHCGKTANGTRGSIALPAAADTVIFVEKRGDIRVARVEKQKDGADGEELCFGLSVVEIGRDDEGEPVTSCVVMPADATSAPPARIKREPTGNAGILLKALRRAISHAGTAAPASNHIPKSARVVTVHQWREYSYQMMAESTEAARQKAFVRGKDSLLGTGHAAAWGEHAWTP